MVKWHCSWIINYPVFDRNFNIFPMLLTVVTPEVQKHGQAISYEIDVSPLMWNRTLTAFRFKTEFHSQAVPKIFASVQTLGSSVQKKYIRSNGLGHPFKKISIHSNDLGHPFGVHCPASRVAFNLSRKIESDSVRRVGVNINGLKSFGRRGYFLSDSESTKTPKRKQNVS